MKTILLLTALTILGRASTLLEIPVAYPDGQSLDPNSPGLGAQVFAIPYSSWLVGVNDNYGNTGPGINGDYDFDDAMMVLTYGLYGAVFNYFGASTADDDLVRIGSGAWLYPGQTAEYSIPPDGQAVSVQMWDASTGDYYVSGPVSGDPTGAIHVWAEVLEPVPPPTAAPESPGWMLIVAGLGLCVVRRAFVSLPTRRRQFGRQCLPNPSS